MAAGRYVLPSRREAQAPEAAATRIDECRDEAYERAFCFYPKTPYNLFCRRSEFSPFELVFWQQCSFISTRSNAR